MVPELGFLWVTETSDQEAVNGDEILAISKRWTQRDRLHSEDTLKQLNIFSIQCRIVENKERWSARLSQGFSKLRSSQLADQT